MDLNIDWNSKKAAESRAQVVVNQKVFKIPPIN